MTLQKSTGMADAHARSFEARMTNILEMLSAHIEELDDKLAHDQVALPAHRAEIDNELLDVLKSVSDFPARTLAELRTKARAAEVAMRADPVGEGGPGFLLVAQSIVRDLWAIRTTESNAQDEAA